MSVMRVSSLDLVLKTYADEKHLDVTKAKISRDSQVIPARLARMARLCPQPAVAMDGTASVNTERAKGLEPSTSSLGS